MLDTLLHMAISGSRPSEPCDIESPDTMYRRSIAGKQFPAISYTTHARVALMSCWADPHYFTAAFPTLFPKGIGGHLEERAIPVSLSALTEWTLNHHSRR
jgi:hypothetical protein